MADHEGEIVERKACAATGRAHDGALLIAGVPEQLVEARRAVLAVIEAGFAPLADGLGGHTVALGQHAGALMGAGDLGAHGWGCAGLGVDGERQRSLLAE